MIGHAFVRSEGNRPDLCKRCQGPAWAHRKAQQRTYSGNSVKPRDRIIGIDGEGKGRGPHLYTYLAAADEHGAHWSVANPEGLTTEQCFEFLLSLPSRALCFGFAFLYDLSKICQGMEDLPLYELFHEETRKRIVDGREVYRPIRWRGYVVNYVNRRFTIERGSRRTVVWDIFRFFATKFTRALIDWKVADKDKLEAMERMKALRSKFDQLSPTEVETYCNEECDYLASLSRRLLDAHEDAGLRLTSFYGAGSTASAFLKRIDIKRHRGEVPAAMRIAIASAFFGGRFEGAFVGPIKGPVRGWDISSAYPYQCANLPCLSCGHWRHRRAGYRGGRLQLIRWTRPVTRHDSRNWGSLPVRLPHGWNKLSKGTIVFPLAAEGGWCWADEFNAALSLDPHLESIESWSYETDCTHLPFADIPGVYRERTRLGKDAKGLVLKLGLNSIYGKLAQSIGLSPPFQSWVWAGNITSGCRAQLLRLMDRNTLMVATDGLWTTDRTVLPEYPRDTGTSDLPKPLGGWEAKEFPRGVFIVRPGIYFPLEPTEDELESVRARGLGRRVVYEQWRRIVDAFDRGAREIKMGGVERFVGAKTGFSIAKGKIKRRPTFGEWIMHDIKGSFNARPKRTRRVGNELLPWPNVDVESIPYDKALSDDAASLVIAEAMAEEQPNVDFSELS